MTAEAADAGPHDLPRRARLMTERVLATAHHLGVSPSGRSLLEASLAAAFSVRHEAGVGEHDPDLLHPGRTALILMLDTLEARAPVLAAAVLAESDVDAFRVPPDRLGVAIPEATVTIVDAVPLASAPDLTERLVTLGRDARLVAVAERLDHVRHVHMARERSVWKHWHVQARDIYAPVAERTHPRLAARMERWCRAFERRLDG